MNREIIKRALCLLAVGTMAGAFACVGEPVDGDGDGDGDGKADEWDSQNNPSNFGNNFEYDWDTLSQITTGASEVTPWPDTYWPMTEDGYNARWNGSSTPSPVELYDLAFNSWTMPEGYMELRPYTSHGQAFDAAYYEKMGRATRWAHEKGGNYRARQIHDPDGTFTSAIDANNDGTVDRDLNGDGQTNSSDNEGGLEGWFGHCHAWAPASFSHPEPQRAVTINGQTFEIADIKALIESTHEGCGGTLFLGGRCNLREIERDEFGRIVDAQSECRDTNAGAFYVVILNVIGRLHRSFVADITTDYQVWNHPVRDFRITRQQEVNEAEACRLVNRSDVQEYPYNTDASRFVDVEMVMRYVVEGSASAEPYIPEIDSYTRSRTYHFLLELNADGMVIGGEWISTNQPDFLWAPTGNCDVRSSWGQPPVISAANVQTLIDQSTTATPPPPVGGEEHAFNAELASPVSIPDDNDTGVSNTLSIPESLNIASLRVNVNIQHTYIGDLRVTLTHGAKTVTLHDRSGGGQDNLVQSFTPTDFNGVDAQGDWTLTITDTAGQDVGTLQSWGVTVITN
jgi:hypothetical protein